MSMENENIYTIALKYGVDNISTGVSFNELHSHLSGRGIAIEKEFNSYFRLWFYENFFVDNSVYHRVKDFIWQNSEQSEQFLSVYDNLKSVIMGHAHQAYLDHQEMKFAYESSIKATKTANAALWVTIIIGVIQIVIALYQSKNH